MSNADSSQQSYAQRGGLRRQPPTPPGSPQKGGEQEELAACHTRRKIHARKYAM